MADRSRFVGRWPFAGGGSDSSPADGQRPTASGFFWFVVAAITVVSLIRIASTHLVFAQTIDEPIHVGAGHEWLTEGTYVLDFEHPPLTRIFYALPFTGVHVEHRDNHEYGNDLYAKDGRYIHNVAKARRPNLLFLAIACVALAAIARRLFGDVVAWIALALFVSLPPVLAHAGLATTDVAGTAGFSVALLALLLWCDAPSWIRTILLGIAIAFGICCKYSFLFFFPPALLIVLIARRRFAPAKLLAAGLLAALLVWGFFGFRFATMESVNPKAHRMAQAAGISERIVEKRVPAPDFFLGLIAVKAHNRNGHPTYILGKRSFTGWWYYFPVALAVKTPIPFLLLCVAPAFLPVIRRRTVALYLMALAVLVIAMTSRINIGVRHLMPMYAPLSIVAALAVVELWNGGRASARPRRVEARRTLTAALLIWLTVSSALAHPDYLPWFNAIAGRHPERVLLDSNFDWGQDIWRLGRLCRKRGITSLGYKVYTNIRPDSIGITGGYLLDERTPGHGWILLSDQELELARVIDPHAYEWLTRDREFERVGKTLRLYHVR